MASLLFAPRGRRFYDQKKQTSLVVATMTPKRISGYSWIIALPLRRSSTF
jgi:hypothetical protein